MDEEDCVNSIETDGIIGQTCEEKINWKII